MPQTTLWGSYIYRHDVHGTTGGERFLLTRHADGGRTLRACCELDDIGLIRDVTYGVDALLRPQDAFVRLVRSGRWQGSAWFRFGEQGIECEAMIADQGRLSQSIATGRRPDVFAPHPVVADGWQAGAMAGAAPGETRRVLNAHCSPLADGSSGPLAYVDDKDILFVGPGELEVAAGRFAVRHYRIDPLTAGLAPLDIWVTGADDLLVRLRWDLLRSTYDLAMLEGDPGLDREIDDQGPAR